MPAAQVEDELGHTEAPAIEREAMDYDVVVVGGGPPGLTPPQRRAQPASPPPSG